jgi:hypothetical protein
MSKMLVGKPDKKRSLGGPGCRGVNNIKIDFKLIERKNLEWIRWFRIGLTDLLL